MTHDIPNYPPEIEVRQNSIGLFDVVEKAGGYVEHEVAEGLVSREKAERIRDEHAAEVIENGG